MSLSASYFHTRPILRNFATKKSVFVDNTRNHLQILCLVGENNDIIVRFRNTEIIPNLSSLIDDDDFEEENVPDKTSPLNEGQRTLFNHTNMRLIVWFRKAGKIIQDICFDPNGRHLLVVCYDNTLHIIPILWIINPEYGIRTTTSQEIETFYWPFRSDEITSFIVPFSGPHECSNSKTCPNNTNIGDNEQATADNSSNSDKYTPTQINEMVLANNAYQSFYLQSNESGCSSESNTIDGELAKSVADELNVDDKKSNGCEKNPSIETDVQDESVERNCPYPLSVAWWSTKKLVEHSHQHRAIIGYSDGSICVVGLAPNCPLIANTSIDRKSGGIVRMLICRETTISHVSLLITASNMEHWKLLLEQNSIGYVYPDDTLRSNDSSKHSSTQSTDTLNVKVNTPDNSWQIVIPVSPKTSIDQSEESFDDMHKKDAVTTAEHPAHTSNESVPLDLSMVPSTSGILPAAARRLLSLKDMGAKKIGALKMKLIESNARANERDRNRQNYSQLACMDVPSLVPQLLGKSTGPLFYAQCLNKREFLGALHPTTNSLSIHTMDANFLPCRVYAVPENVSNVVLTTHIMYSVQSVNNISDDAKPDHMDVDHENDEKLGFSPVKSTKINENVNVVGVIGSKLAQKDSSETKEIDPAAVLCMFPFPDDEIIDLYRIPPDVEDDGPPSPLAKPKEPSATGSPPMHRKFSQPPIITENYYNRYANEMKNIKAKQASDEVLYGMGDEHILEYTFPMIQLEACLVVTSRSVLMIELNNEPHVIFLNLVHNAEWEKCEQFCKVFGLDYNRCMEYGGDALLRRNFTEQALQAYELGQVLPIKIGLKLAMFGRNVNLMCLCADTLKISHVVGSTYPKNHVINYVMQQSKQRSPSDLDNMSETERNCGKATSNFSYEQFEPPTDLQMSNSSQFHLANLLLLTLTERAIMWDEMMPLWNFLVTNKRFHTNMSSIVLAQSGLYTSTTVLALNRGAQMDVFCALAGVVNQQFAWYSEFHRIMYELSDPMFMECIIYLQPIAIEYLKSITAKSMQLTEPILERLRHQLDPFTAIFRPVVSQLSSNFVESDSNDISRRSIGFCKLLIETFLIVIMRLYTLKYPNKDEITNGLNLIYVHHEQNQFAIKIDNGTNISAGFAHAGAIVDGSCYLWGSNGLNCALSGSLANIIVDANTETAPRCLEFMPSMGLEVHAIKCGKMHTLILTNNGLYAMGSNVYQQLGIGKRFVQALHPKLVQTFDGKNISLIEAGQYHNAVYADNQLYTFGWNIYGQLGHGDIQAIETPKVVEFFNNKCVRQIALGHAHTLVLCANNLATFGSTLYVFGCNLFGQLGLGQYEHSNQKYCKSSIPRRFDLIDETIVLVHTKYFTNFVVTQSNKLYTWGASPQYIRLMNTSRKRERLSKKVAEATIAQENEPIEEPRGSSMASIEQTGKAEADYESMAINGQAASGSNGKKNKHHTANSSHSSNIEERLRNLWRARGSKKVASPRVPAQTNAKPYENNEYIDDEYTDHFNPTQVDTGEIDANIAQISTGLYHNVLITTTMQMYTWGRNLEKQLGYENTRCDILRPTRLELSDNVIAIDCGGDFTIYQTDNYTVKAFGNNNVGQCGHEIASDRQGGPKLIRLRQSKRFVRVPDTSLCINTPFEIQLPRPKIRMNYDPVRYLKSIPQYRPGFVCREIFRDAGISNDSSSSDIAAACGIPSPDIHRSLPNDHTAKSQQSDTKTPTSIGTDVNSDFIHYCLYILHGIYDARKILSFTTITEFKVRILMLNYQIRHAFALCLTSAKATIAQHQSQENVHLGNLMLSNYVIRLFEYFTKDASLVPIHRTDLKYLIHAIFVFFMENALHMEPLEAYFLNNVDHYLFGLSFVLFFTNNTTKLERKVQQKYYHLFSGCVPNANLYGRTRDDSNSQTTGDDETEQTQSSASTTAPSEEPDFELVFKNVSVRFKTIVCQRLIEFDKQLS